MNTIDERPKLPKPPEYSPAALPKTINASPRVIVPPPPEDWDKLNLSRLIAVEGAEIITAAEGKKLSALHAEWARQFEIFESNGFNPTRRRVKAAFQTAAGELNDANLARIQLRTIELPLATQRKRASRNAMKLLYTQITPIFGNILGRVIESVERVISRETAREREFCDRVQFPFERSPLVRSLEFHLGILKRDKAELRVDYLQPPAKWAGQFLGENWLSQ